MARTAVYVPDLSDCAFYHARDLTSDEPAQLCVHNLLINDAQIHEIVTYMNERNVAEFTLQISQCQIDDNGFDALLDYAANRTIHISLSRVICTYIAWEKFCNAIYMGCHINSIWLRYSLEHYFNMLTAALASPLCRIETMSIYGPVFTATHIDDLLASSVNLTSVSIHFADINLYYNYAEQQYVNITEDSYSLIHHINNIARLSKFWYVGDLCTKDCAPLLDAVSDIKNNLKTLYLNVQLGDVIYDTPIMVQLEETDDGKLALTIQTISTKNSKIHNVMLNAIIKNIACISSIKYIGDRPEHIYDLLRYPSIYQLILLTSGSMTKMIRKAKQIRHITHLTLPSQLTVSYYLSVIRDLDNKHIRRLDIKYPPAEVVEVLDDFNRRNSVVMIKGAHKL